MIRLDLTARNFELDDKMRNYLSDKVNDLERLLPRQVRASASAVAVLTDDPGGREANQFVCEVILTVEGEKFMAKEGAINMYAAIDIVDAKVSSQVRTYKDKHVNQPRRARMLGRLMGRTSEADPSAPALDSE
jgi:putative sigma-54 modulation protein